MDLTPHFNNPQFSDSIIQTETDKIYVHKVLLCSNSIYFKCMFGSGFKESNERMIELREDNPSALFTMLQHMYMDNNESHEVKDLVFLVALYHLADKYDAPRSRAAYLGAFNDFAKVRWGSMAFITALQDIFDHAIADKSSQQAAISCCTAHIDPLSLLPAFNKVLENSAPLSAASLHEVASTRLNCG